MTFNHLASFFMSPPTGGATLEVASALGCYCCYVLLSSWSSSSGLSFSKKSGGGRGILILSLFFRQNNAMNAIGSCGLSRSQILKAFKGKKINKYNIVEWYQQTHMLFWFKKNTKMVSLI